MREYPEKFGNCRDSDGRTPRHTFFYPIEEYDPAHLDALAELCRHGFGEVELHLHHDNDTAENLRATLLDAQEIFARRHGLLAHDRRTGQATYGFIHGNWALDNSRPDGRWCGVNNELEVLRETGCYADFTFPSAPQPDTDRRRSTASTTRSTILAGPARTTAAIDVGTGPPPTDGLMLIQGPLLLDWRRAAMGSDSARSRMAASRPVSRPALTASTSGFERASRCRSGRTGSSSSFTPTVPRKRATKPSSASRWCDSTATWPMRPARIQPFITITSPRERCTISSRPRRRAGRAGWPEHWIIESSARRPSR